MGLETWAVRLAAELALGWTAEGCCPYVNRVLPPLRVFCEEWDS
jgi:hypothetical protein